MRKMMLVTILVLVLVRTLAGVAQGGDERNDVDVCIVDATADWSLPQTLDEALTLREALDAVIEQCTELPPTIPSVAESKTMYVNTGAGQVNIRRTPHLAAPIVVKVAQGTSVESLGEVEGDEFGDSTIWHHVSVDDVEGYAHSLLLSDTKPVPKRVTVSSPDSSAQAATTQDTPPQGTTPISVTWHEGLPPIGTCKDNVFHQRIYRGCVEGISNSKLNDLVRHMSCASPSWQALGFECRGWYCVREGYPGTTCTP